MAPEAIKPQSKSTQNDAGLQGSTWEKSLYVNWESNFFFAIKKSFQKALFRHIRVLIILKGFYLEPYVIGKQYCLPREASKVLIEVLKFLRVSSMSQYLLIPLYNIAFF